MVNLIVGSFMINLIVVSFMVNMIVVSFMVNLILGQPDLWSSIKLNTSLDDHDSEKFDCNL